MKSEFATRTLIGLVVGISYAEEHTHDVSLNVLLFNPVMVRYSLVSYVLKSLLTFFKHY